MRPVLDPEIQIFVDKMTGDWASHQPFMELPLEQARAIAERVREPWTRGGPVMERVEEHLVPTSTGELRVRIYDPGLGGDAPALLYLHGGGFTLFSIDTHDRLMREYAAAGDFIVVGIDYPLAPEHKYPFALDQIVELIRWLEKSTIGIDPKRLAVGGDSAGGNLSLAACLRLRDSGETDRIRGMLLNYGGFRPGCSDEAEAELGGEGSVLNRQEADYYWSNYLQGPQDEQDPYACPLLADLTGLPPTLLVVPECDLIAEQSFLMAQRMLDAGVDVTIKVYPGATHSFLEAMSISQLARDAIKDGACWVNDQLKSQ